MEEIPVLVSVIIPVYNAQMTIGKALQSVVSQTYTHLEIIVVNDGSTDESLSIISEYKSQDSRIILFEKQNKGLVKARKSGIEIATGKYIQYLDSDDVLYENAIASLVTRAEEMQADIVVAPFVFSFSHNEKKQSSFFDFVELSGIQYLKEIFNRKAYWSVWSKFHLRSLYQNEIERLDISLGEDVVLSTQLLIYSKRVVSVSDVIIDYNFTSSSMSHPANFDDRKYNDFVNYTTWVETFLAKRGLKEEFQESIALFHLENTFRQIAWRRLQNITVEMKRLIDDLELFPYLMNILTKRESKIVKAYKKSYLIGRLRLAYYCWRGKI